jgi:hypothetical protein
MAARSYIRSAPVTFSASTCPTHGRQDRDVAAHRGGLADHDATRTVAVLGESAQVAPDVGSGQVVRHVLGWHDVVAVVVLERAPDTGDDRVILCGQGAQRHPRRERGRRLPSLERAGHLEGGAQKSGFGCPRAA